jgi:hypothetical protein
MTGRTQPDALCVPNAVKRFAFRSNSDVRFNRG